MLITYTSMFGWPLAIIFALALALAIAIINFIIGIIKDFFCKKQCNVDMNINQSSQFMDIEATQFSRIPTFDNTQFYSNSGVSGWRRSSIPNNLEITNISRPPQSVQHQRSHSAIALPSDLPPSYFETVTSKRSDTPPPQYYNIFCEFSV